MKIFVFGDSFAADPAGWSSMLDCEVTNFAENGIGQYKIYKKILNNLKFDRAIICHTSPWRVHTRIHPLHKDNLLRPNNDFMLNDLEYHSKKNKEIKNIYNYLKKYHDFIYQSDMYKLMVSELMHIKNTVHVTFHDPDDTKIIKNNFFKIWKNYKGNINHLSLEGNQIVAQKVKKLL